MTRTLLILLIGLTATGHARSSEPLVDRELTALLVALDGIRREHDVAALGLCIVEDDALLWAGSSGIADRASGRPADGDTVFRVGSVTKAFTGLALLMAEDEGQLSLDASLKSVTPEAPLVNPWATTHPVRLAHLLEHTSGLQDMTREEFDHSDPTPLALTDAVRFRPEARRVVWQPGTHSSYSNVGSGLAAYALERATDTRYENYVAERIFTRLGMDSAGFFVDQAIAGDLATGYDTDGMTEIPYWHIIFRPAGGMNIRPADFAPFLRLMINRGTLDGRRLLDARTIRRMETPTTTLAARRGLEYGYGLGIYQWQYNGFTFHGHGGDADGYLAHFGYNLDTRRGYFMVINAYNHRPLRRLRRVVEAYLVRDAKRPSPPPAVARETELALYAGRYRSVTSRFPWSGMEPTGDDVLEVSLEDGRLYTVRSGARKRPLIPVDGTFFRRRDETVATAAFVRDDRGTLVLQGDMGNYVRQEEPPGRSTRPPTSSASAEAGN